MSMFWVTLGWLDVAVWRCGDGSYTIDCMSFLYESATWPNPLLHISLHPLKPPLGMEYRFPTPLIISKCPSCHFYISFSLVQLVSSLNRGDTYSAWYKNMPVGVSSTSFMVTMVMKLLYSRRIEQIAKHLRVLSKYQQSGHFT